MATTTATSSSTASLESLTETAFQYVISTLSKLHSQLNRIIPPERQATIKTQLTDFSSRRPLLASLILSQLAFSGIPILLFALLSIGVLLFSLVTALVVGLLVALLFTAMCVGFGLLVLLPVLMVTTFLAVSVCGWGWAGWFVLRWFGKGNNGPASRDQHGEKSLKVEGKSSVENGWK